MQQTTQYRDGQRFQVGDAIYVYVNGRFELERNAEGAAVDRGSTIPLLGPVLSQDDSLVRSLPRNRFGPRILDDLVIFPGRQYAQPVGEWQGLSPGAHPLSIFGPVPDEAPSSAALAPMLRRPVGSTQAAALSADGLHGGSLLHPTMGQEDWLESGDAPRNLFYPLFSPGPQDNRPGAAARHPQGVSGQLSDRASSMPEWRPTMLTRSSTTW